MRSQVRQLTGVDVDPEQIYLHYFRGAVSSDTAFTGWVHPQQPVRSLTLSTLAFANFTLEDELSGPGDLDLTAGFYTQGPGSLSGYGVGNEFKLLPSRLMALNWTHDFYTGYKAILDGFWQAHSADFRLLLKGQFIAACRAGRQARRLTEADYNALMLHAVPGLDLTASVTLEQLQAEHLNNAGVVRRFDLYGYASSDILHFALAGGRHAVFIPVPAPILVVFESTPALQAWVIEQARNPEKRSALAAHFSLYDRQDGKTYSGVDSALKGLAAGSWAVDTIDLKDRVIAGDVFSSTTQQLRDRYNLDADTLIKSNGELNKELWITDLSAFEKVVLPIAPLGAPIAVVAAAGGVALLGLGLDQTVAADSLPDRQQGAWTAFFATLDILFSAGAAPERVIEDGLELTEPTEIIEHAAVPAGILQGQTADADGIYRLGNQWFVRSFDQVYRISVAPVRDQVKVINPTGEDAGALFFLRRVGTTDQWARLGLSGGAPIAENAMVRQLIWRDTNWKTGEVNLRARFGGYIKAVSYDLLENAFQKVSRNSTTGRWENLDGGRLYRPQQGQMVDVEPLGEVLDSERMATLRALDIDLQLPVDFSPVDTDTLADIPPVIHSVWVGDKLINAKLLATLQKNAQLASEGARPYALELHLSNEHASVFAENRRLLQRHAPAVQIEVLEESAFYQAFSASQYFQQYRAALEGNGGIATNFSSAADVLRYRLMAYEGGLYLDLDDTLQVAPGALIIKTSPSGLALPAPVGQQILGMDAEFNTSFFGTQKNNPTLEAISEESYRRYQQDPGLYTRQRPYLGQDDNDVFQGYMSSISQTTGPGVFNHVIDERLPDLQQIRMLFKLMSRRIIVPLEDLDEWTSQLTQRLPLMHAYRIGSEHSWKQTR
ncbi:hypothetical protein GUY40_00500 [Pseudomonas sp. R5(2019)]|nr:DUF6543 domain-containing protein [Pseudomonas sp. R5(2019)]NBA93457.1 hypothetical protein [Pseudomonas sp. R5(2019)]